MKRIVLDNIIYSLQQSGGISMIWSAVTDAVLHSDLSTSFIERKDVDRNLFRAKLCIPFESIEYQDRPLWIDRYSSVKSSEKEPFIFHSSYYRNCINQNANKVVTVHDFTYEKIGLGNIFARSFHHKQKMKAINNADKIVCVSRNTYDDLIDICGNCILPKVEVIYNGVLDNFKYQNTDFDDYVLFVGSRAKYKNFILAAEAVSLAGLRLAVCGDPLSQSEHKILSRYFPAGGYAEFVNADDLTLNKLYNSAFCLLYPSEYEGFGLPIVEAQKAGCPVVACSNSSIPEVMGDSPLLIKNNITAMDIKIKLNLLRNPSVREEVVEAGVDNSRRFTMERMQQQYIDLYNSL